MLDLEDNVIQVLKISHDKCESIIFDEVKAQTIAACMAEMYNAKNPPMSVKFISCCVYVLAQRDKRPAFRAEQKIESRYHKTKLRDASLISSLYVSAVESDTLEAFELFAYHRSGHKFVLYNPSRVGELDHMYWTEPSYFRFFCSNFLFL